MLETEVTAKCSIHNIPDGVTNNFEIVKHPQHDLYSFNIRTSPYLTDPAKFHIYISKESLQLLQATIKEMLDYSNED